MQAQRKKLYIIFISSKQIQTISLNVKYLQTSLKNDKKHNNMPLALSFLCFFGQVCLFFTGKNTEASHGPSTDTERRLGYSAWSK